MFVIASGQHDEERRRVDAAIVTAERNFFEGRHLSFASFMQDFADLRILFGRSLLRLGGRQIGQHAACYRRIDPQKLECSDEAIASKGTAEPWDPRVGIWAFVCPRSSCGDRPTS